MNDIDHHYVSVPIARAPQAGVIRLCCFSFRGWHPDEAFVECNFLSGRAEVRLNPNCHQEELACRRLPSASIRTTLHHTGDGKVALALAPAWAGGASIRATIRTTDGVAHFEGVWEGSFLEVRHFYQGKVNPVFIEHRNVGQ